MKMINFISDFFRDNTRSASMTRLMSFIAVLGGVIMAFIYPDNYVGYIGIITLGFGGKIGQKGIENYKLNK